MKMLQLTPHLHQEGSIDIEATHDDAAKAPWYTLRVQQHNEGPPEQARWCPPNTVANRTPKSYAVIVGKKDADGNEVSAGDVHLLRDCRTKRYAMGTVRWATATANSVAGNPPTVAISDSEHGCSMTAEVAGAGTTDPGIKSGDKVAYVIEYDGTPVTFSGGRGLIKVGIALSNARQGGQTEWSANPAYTTLQVQHTLSGATHTVRLANTPAGQTPNVNAGATVIYALADDDAYWCLSDYTDDPVGTLRPQQILAIYSDAWERHEDSIGKNLPHYGEAPFPSFLGQGGRISHTHEPHAFTLGPHELTFSSVDVMTEGTFDPATCQFTGTTVCVLAGVE